MTMKVENTQEDLRIRRTHKLLVDALMDSLMEKPFEKISVTDICEKAMVHRTTFYSHFEDKYHLLNFFFQTLQKEFDEKSKIDIKNTMNPKDYYLGLFRHLLEFMEENKKLYVLGIFRIGNDSVMHTFHKSISTYIRHKLESNVKNLGIEFLIPIPIIAEYHTGALIALVSGWLENDTKPSIDTLIGYTDLLLNTDRYISK